jgi:bifunctional NMN adenylyltransferase/nudix hydrolase
MKKYDIAVIIGRFQPIHKGHIPLFRKAQEIADHTACIVGSINKPSTPKNPFSFETRHTFIVNALANEAIDTENVSILGVEDTFYREQEWYRNVRFELEPLIKRVKAYKADHARDDLNALLGRLDPPNTWDLHIHLHGMNNTASKEIVAYRNLLKESSEVHIAVLGYVKDESSYYLKNFADWEIELIPATGIGVALSATKIRELWYEYSIEYAENVLHPYTYNYMHGGIAQHKFLDLREDYLHVVEYDKETQVGPFPVQFLTTDAVVLHGDEVLLVKRGGAPGRGQWALPGGFVDNYETFYDASVRELIEETQIDVPEKVIRGSKKDEKMFDFPKRSSRGRTVSMAYLFVLDPTRPRPRVRASKDNETVQAWWFSLSEVEGMHDQMYEDHPDIIDYLTARI